MRGCKTRCNFARQVTKRWRFPSKHDRIQLAPNSEREMAQNSNSKKGTWILGLGPWFLFRHIFPARPHCRCKQPAMQRSWNEKNRVCESGSLFKKVKRCTAPCGPTSWFVPGFLCSVSLSTPPNFSTSSKSEETHKGIGLAAFEIKRIVHWLLKTLIPTGLLRSHTFPSSGFVTRTSLWPGRCGQKLTRKLDKQGAAGFHLFSGILYIICIYIERERSVCVTGSQRDCTKELPAIGYIYIYVCLYIHGCIYCDENPTPLQHSWVGMTSTLQKKNPNWKLEREPTAHPCPWVTYASMDGKIMKSMCWSSTTCFVHTTNKVCITTRGTSYKSYTIIYNHI